MDQEFHANHDLIYEMMENLHADKYHQQIK